MHPSRKYLDPTELAKLQGLRLQARGIVDGFLAGRHRSAGRGLSLEFSEHREYSPGDDWRHVDWKVFARTDKYYLKTFEDEANLACYFLLDCSESMSFRGPNSPMTKLHYAKCLLASMAWLVQSRQDAIGLATLSDTIEFRPAAGSETALNEMVDRLEATSARGTCINDSISDFANLINRRSVVVFISDCFADVDQLVHSLQQIRHRRHDVSVLQVLDPAELDFPFTSTIEFEGMEGTASITADTARIARSYRERIASFCKQLRMACGRHSIRYQQIRTDESFDKPLAHFLSPASNSI